jgi:hypothetical protein
MIPESKGWDPAVVFGGNLRFIDLGCLFLFLVNEETYVVEERGTIANVVEVVDTIGVRS